MEVFRLWTTTYPVGLLFGRALEVDISYCQSIMECCEDKECNCILFTQIQGLNIPPHPEQLFSKEIM